MTMPAIDPRNLRVQDSHTLRSFLLCYTACALAACGLRGVAVRLWTRAIPYIRRRVTGHE